MATGRYTADPGLRRLRAPAGDADDLAQVLADPDIGGFAVTTIIDQSAHQIRLAIEDFLADRGTGDLLLVYLSCHGLLDARRRLYFAATDTRKDRLGSTGVEAAWVLDQLEHCRARRQVLILDSCFSGAFAHGTKGEADLGLRDRFLGQGRGRVVLTASTATEYSFEGDPTNAAITPAGSVFTAALVRGLRTGEADGDHDGHVSADDAYAYVFDQVQAAGAAQTPQRWVYGAEGKILLARSPAGPTIIPAPLPDSLRAGLDSPHPGIRIGAVTELGEWLIGGDPSRAATAGRHLQEVADTDIARVAGIARTLLDTAGDGGSEPGNDLVTGWQLVDQREGQVYQWPETLEHYDRYDVYRGETQAEGAVFISLGRTLRHGAWGADRIYVVSFLSQQAPQTPLAEFLAVDDYAETGDLIAVIRGSDGGRRMYGPTEDLPPAYAQFRIATYRDRVQAKGAWNKLAVVAAETDTDAILNHALIQARRRGNL